MPNVRNAAQRALDIIQNLGGTAEEFRHKWLTIHAFSTEFERGDQRVTLIDTIEHSLSEENAEEIMLSLSDEMEYLRDNPVGDLRFEDADPRFYRNSRQDITQSFLEDRSFSNRLGHLICVVYQVRCNVEHGRKELGSARSQKLFVISNKIMDMVIAALLKEIEAA